MRRRTFYAAAARREIREAADWLWDLAAGEEPALPGCIGVIGAFAGGLALFVHGMMWAIDADSWLAAALGWLAVAAGVALLLPPFGYRLGMIAAALVSLPFVVLRLAYAVGRALASARNESYRPDPLPEPPRLPTPAGSGRLERRGLSRPHLP